VNRFVATRSAGSEKHPVQGAAIFSRQAWAEIGRSLQLSGRELQIVRGVFNDQTEFAIAADLGISPHTVHTHIERLHRKLGVPDRVKLVVRVMDEFLARTIAPGSDLPSICANRAAGRCPLLMEVSKRLPPVLPRGIRKD
jgi:DNA-binding CsgD family transcriptional regulator